MKLSATEVDFLVLEVYPVNVVDGSDSCTRVANMNCLLSRHVRLTRTELEFSCFGILSSDG